MKAFLSYKFGEDMSTVKNLLIENKIEVFDSLTDISYVSSLQVATKNAIKNCDFLVFIYSEDNADIAFEAGIAIGLNKPIFSIFTRLVDNAFLLESTYVYAQPNEAEKIRFGLEIFLKNLKPKKSIKREYHQALKEIDTADENERYQNNRDLIDKYDALINKPQDTLEAFIQEILVRDKIKIFKKPLQLNESATRSFADFSIWSDELYPLLQSPIAIEVKRVLNHHNISLLDKYDANLGNNMGSLIVLYNRLEGLQQKDLRLLSNRLYIPIQDLVKELEYSNFAEAIKKVRNNIIHNK